MGTGTYQGVILAAGHGSRMGPFGDYVPKPIVPVCNKPLVAYQLEQMRDVGIEEVFVVIGHLGHRIIQTLGDGSKYGVRIEYVEQKERLGLAHAVGLLECYVDTAFLLILGDMYFEVSDLGGLMREMEREQAAAVLGVRIDTDPEQVRKNYAVLVDERGDVCRVIEKPRHVTEMRRGCGIYLFGLPVFDAIRRTPRTAMRDEYELTDSIQILVDYGYRVRAWEVVEWDMNITYPRDLITCCLHGLRKAGRPFIVGEECSVSDEARLVDTVVCDGASIAGPATLERCVVMPGASIEDGEHYADSVITKEGALKAGANDAEGAPAC